MSSRADKNAHRPHPNADGKQRPGQNRVERRRPPPLGAPGLGNFKIGVLPAGQLLLWEQEFPGFPPLGWPLVGRGLLSGPWEPFMFWAVPLPALAADRTESRTCPLSSPASQKPEKGAAACRGERQPPEPPRPHRSSWGLRSGLPAAAPPHPQPCPGRNLVPWPRMSRSITNGHLLLGGRRRASPVPTTLTHVAGRRQPRETEAELASTPNVAV